jgi:predicted nucleotidyltransferase
MPREAKIIKNNPPLIDGFAVQKADGAEFALQHNELLKIKGRMPQGGTNTVELLVASIPALLVMKGHAIRNRDKPKDAYDIYYCILNYSGGAKALAKDCEPLLASASAKRGYAAIAEKFADLDGFGPTSVRKFVEQTDILGERTADQ